MLSEQSSSLTPAYSAHLTPPTPSTDAHGSLWEVMPCPALLVLPGCASADYFPTPAWRCPCSGPSLLSTSSRQNPTAAAGMFRHVGSML